MRIVLDINVFISGIISKEGAPGQLLTLWRERHYVLIASHAQIDRMQDVLRRPRLKPFLEEADADEFMANLLDAAVIVEHDPSVNLSADPEDNIILGTAIAGKADILVTGDQKHLIPLGTVEGIPILTPREAIEKILSSTAH